MFIKKGNAEYRVLEQRPPSFLAGLQLAGKPRNLCFLADSGGTTTANGFWRISAL
jgi:hypothetical protein